MIFNIHAGHNPDGKTACGAVGIISESTEARLVKDKVIDILRYNGHTVYDCTCDTGRGQNDVLNKIVKKCNEHNVDYDISIHFNAGRNDHVGDGSTGGTECWIYPNGGANALASNICTEISKIGYRNRGVKSSKDLYFLANTKAKAVLIECCFVDDKDDVNIYSVDNMARAIANALIGLSVSNTIPNINYSTCYPAYTGNSKSIVDALASIGIPASFNKRKSIASANGIVNYIGSADQNTKMLNLLKNGQLKRG